MDYGPDLINEVANRYIQAINNGFGLIRGNVFWILNVLIVMSIVWSAIVWMLSDEPVAAQFVRKIVYIGIFTWIVQNWQSLTDKLAWFFMNLGLKAGGFSEAFTYTQEPGNIAYLGYTTGQPLIDQISRMCGPINFFTNFPEIIFLTLALVTIIAAFCVITIQVIVALLSFKFGALAAFVVVPFGVLTKTAFIAERPLGWIVGSGVRLMVLTLVLGVGNNLYQQMTPKPGSPVTMYEAFVLALSALILMVLSLVASRLATDMIIGGPSLGVGTALNTTAVAYQTVNNAVSRPAVLAVKAAAAVSTKGTSLAWDAGRATSNAVRIPVSKAAASVVTVGASHLGGALNKGSKGRT